MINVSCSLIYERRVPGAMGAQCTAAGLKAVPMDGPPTKVPQHCSPPHGSQLSQQLLNIPDFASFSFLIQNSALHSIQFIKKAKYFTSHIIAFISQTTSPVTSHQLIFHRHILIDINCIISPYLHISQVLYHSFHYFARLADLQLFSSLY